MNQLDCELGSDDRLYSALAGQRRALEVIQDSSSKTSKNDSLPLPPLLKKIMAEYPNFPKKL
ncbi:MAG: hypothetical protein HQK75_15840 [Candidatus Magnetomorum sp.]|nr:hypothetical protein [Candidatus Magnetomorum sp.]